MPTTTASSRSVEKAPNVTEPPTERTTAPREMMAPGPTCVVPSSRADEARVK
ncbi:hypothetical protein KH5H1_65020 [Corallococcus caeni]|nr:hypothetical protein KH5H1_65020 [Corallococcus sp. KH5-1]